MTKNEDSVSAVNPAKKRANKAWDSKNLDRMSVAFPRGTKDRIKESAQASGISVNRWLLEAVEGKLDSASSREEVESLVVGLYELYTAERRRLQDETRAASAKRDMRSITMLNAKLEEIDRVGGMIDTVLDKWRQEND